MCGIFGVINGKKDRSARTAICKFMENAFVAGTVRGDDSSGTFYKDSKSKIFYHKQPVDGGAFVNDATTKSILFDADTSHFMVGHNRAATQGLVSEENAHPFNHYDKLVGGVTGVHNGTLVDWRSIDSSEGIKVDSDWAMKMLLEKELKAFEYFKGAYCYVWYDSRHDKELRIARNSLRPMFFSFEKGKNTMLFASEAGMLSWLAERNNIDIENTIYEVESGQLYKFSLDNPRDFNKEVLPKVVDSHFPKVSSSYSSSRSTAWDNYDSHYGGTGGRYGRGNYSAGTNGGNYSSQDLFLNKLESAITEALKDKKTTIGTPSTNTEVPSELTEAHAKEAEQMQVLNCKVKAFPYNYDSLTGAIKWEVLDSDDMDDILKFWLDSMEGAVSVNVPYETYLELKNKQPSNLVVEGVYYKSVKGDWPTLLLTNETILKGQASNDLLKTA